jgi:hypothetical protein
MNIVEFFDTVIAAIKFNLELMKDGIGRDAFIVPMGWSEPGIGKTTVMRKAIQNLGNFGWELFADHGATEQTTWRYQDVDFQTRDQADLGGNPWVQNGKSVRLPPDWIIDHPMTVYSLDELAQANPGCLNLAGQMIHEGRIGEHKFPKGAMFIGASNPAGSRAGTTALPGQLRSRMVHYNILPDAEIWADHAVERGINPYIIAYNRYRARGHGKHVAGIQDRIKFHHNYDQKALAYPCARSWSFLNSAIKMRHGDLRNQHDAQGCVGEAAADDFLGFIDCIDRLPDLASIISSPTTAMLPDSIDTMFVTMQALSTRANQSNFHEIVTYLRRIPELEFAELCIADTLAANPGLKFHGAYGAWQAHTGQSFQKAA